MARRLTPAEKDQLYVELALDYTQGKTLHEIAAERKVALKTIRLALAKTETPLRRPGTRPATTTQEA